MVARQLSWKESSAKRRSREDLPTEALPMITTLNRQSYSRIMLYLLLSIHYYHSYIPMLRLYLLLSIHYYHSYIPMLRHLLHHARKYINKPIYFTEKHLRKLKDTTFPPSSPPKDQSEQSLSYKAYLLTLLETPEIIEEVMLSPQQFRGEMGYDSVQPNGSLSTSYEDLKLDQTYEKVFKECIAKLKKPPEVEVHGVYDPHSQKQKPTQQPSLAQRSQREKHYDELNKQDENEALKIIAKYKETIPPASQEISPQEQQLNEKIIDIFQNRFEEDTEISNEVQKKQESKSQSISEPHSEPISEPNHQPKKLFKKNASQLQITKFKMEVQAIINQEKKKYHTQKNNFFLQKNVELINKKPVNAEEQLLLIYLKDNYETYVNLKKRLFSLQKEKEKKSEQKTETLEQIGTLLYEQKVSKLLKLIKKQSEKQFEMSPADVDVLFEKEHTRGELTLRLELAYEIMSRIKESDGISFADAPSWLLSTAHRLRLHPNTPAHDWMVKIVSLLPRLKWHFDLQSASYIQLICAVHFHSHDVTAFVSLLPEVINVSHLQKQWLLYRADYSTAPFVVNEFLIEKYKEAMKEENIYECIKCVYVGAMAAYEDLLMHFLAHQHKVFYQSQIEQVQEYIISAMLNSPSLHSRTLKHKYPFLTTPLKQHHYKPRSLIYREQQKIVFRVDKPKNIVFEGLLEGYEYEETGLGEQVKSLIKRGCYREAIEQFKTRLLIPSAAQRWRLNLEFVLDQYVTDKMNKNQKYTPIDEEQKDQLVSRLSVKQLLSFYQRSQDYTQEYKEFLPVKQFSYWESVWEREESDYLLSSRAKGLLRDMVQRAPQKYTFEVNKWIDSIPIDMKAVKHSYELEKQLIRYKNEIKAIIYEMYSYNDFELNEKIKKAQENLSEEVKDVLHAFSLYSFDFTVTDKNLAEEQQSEEMALANDARKMKTMVFESLPSFNMRFNMMLAANCRVTGADDLLRGLMVSERETEWNFNLLEQLYFQKPTYFKNAERICKLEREPLVEEMVLWGVANEEPLAIYLGEKLAMLTNQVIQHEVAKRASDYLSYRRAVPPERVEECKLALSLVGKIDRQHIYSPSYDYHHILVRDQFSRYTQQINEEVYHLAALKFLNRFVPETRLTQIEPEFFFQSAQQGPL